MFDLNLMLLDAATITADGAVQTGAYLDLWSVNADTAPVISAYEVADPPGQGGAVRPLVWDLIVAASALISDAFDMALEFSNDGVGAAESEVEFGAVAAVDPLVAFVRRIVVHAPERFVRYRLEALGGVSTAVVTLGPRDGGEYTDPGP